MLSDVEVHDILAVAELAFVDVDSEDGKDEPEEHEDEGDGDDFGDGLEEGFFLDVEDAELGDDFAGAEVDEVEEDLQLGDVDEEVDEVVEEVEEVGAGPDVEVGSLVGEGAEGDDADPGLEEDEDVGGDLHAEEHCRDGGVG